MKSIVFVTGNKHKIKEAEEILHIPLETADIDLEEIQETDLEKVALHKLQQAYERIRKPVMVDDVGVYIHAWNNFPGPLIKWVVKAKEPSGSLILKMLQGEKDRTVTVRLAVGFHDGKMPHLFFGEIQGTIADKMRGDNGFDWDKLFIPDGQTKTYAQMSPEEKNTISHRKIALTKLENFLKTNYTI